MRVNGLGNAVTIYGRFGGRSALAGADEAAHGFGHAIFQRIGGEPVANGDLAEFRHAARQGWKVRHRQIVTGIDAKPVRGGGLRRFAKFFQLDSGLFGIIMQPPYGPV